MGVNLPSPYFLSQFLPPSYFLFPLIQVHPVQFSLLPTFLFLPPSYFFPLFLPPPNFFWAISPSPLIWAGHVSIYGHEESAKLRTREWVSSSCGNCEITNERANKASSVFFFLNQWTFWISWLWLLKKILSDFKDRPFNVSFNATGMAEGQR